MAMEELTTRLRRLGQEVERVEVDLARVVLVLDLLGGGAAGRVPALDDAHTLKDGDREQDDEPEDGPALLHALEVAQRGATNVAAEERVEALLEEA